MGTRFRVAVLVCSIMAVHAAPARSQPPEGSNPPPPRAIPGITADDPFPQGCVSCHVQLPDRDVRLSTAMGQWEKHVDPPLLAKAQLVMPEGVTLTGKHPPVEKALENIPAGCMTCHGRGAKKAPYFGRLLHVIHLTGAGNNHFMTEFQGECTYCHKLDPATGTWSIPSGKEGGP
jgi:hypothetical protein